MTSPLTLLLSAAEQRLQFGLLQAGELLCGQDWAAASQGAELLTPALADALRRLRLTPAAVGRIACVTGPGGFTGLRLALSTASALRHTLGVPLAGINYLELLAEGTPSLSGQAVRVLTHARRELVYCQDFLRGDDARMHALAPPCVLELHAMLEKLPYSVYPVMVIGSGLSRHAEQLVGTDGVQPLPCFFDQPRWDAWRRVAERATYSDADLEPVYLRASEAEDNLEKLAAQRGDDPVQARARLQLVLQRPPDTLL